MTLHEWCGANLCGSFTQLQMMLQLCGYEVQNVDLIFSRKKSCLFKVGISFNENVSNLHLNGGDVC